jgi:hypothetical protein
MRRHKSAAQPVQIARQAVDSAREAASNVDLGEVRDTMADVTSSMKETLTEQAMRAAEGAREAASNVDLADVKETVTAEVAKDYDLVLDETRRQPLRSLLIALGAGTLIGMAAGRMRERRKAAKAKRDERPAWGPNQQA